MSHSVIKVNHQKFSRPLGSHPDGMFQIEHGSRWNSSLPWQAQGKIGTVVAVGLVVAFRCHVHTSTSRGNGTSQGQPCTRNISRNFFYLIVESPLRILSLTLLPPSLRFSGEVTAESPPWAKHQRTQYRQLRFVSRPKIMPDYAD